MLTPDDLRYFYAHGQCHAFALGCHAVHGGDFVVAFDAGEVIATERDGGEHHAVIHILARIEVPDGLVLRDYEGDRPDDPDVLREELHFRYGVWREDIMFEELCLGELAALIEDRNGKLRRHLKIEVPHRGLRHVDRPLIGIGAGEIAFAAALDEAKAPPGTRGFPDPAADMPSP
ncbi:hypothetical protein LAZ40_04460 [Cereibacter sphaeroides]|uniref:hypothetical protein n=1 Tax=Cereibacter sphaeroides TaxID=1063 RepID=UPI001F32A950|nr:hypothetical protein [Cereibacter sphaeroides]MCE6958308.1 hypothetical protein [Cereibacter sphaeroides]MCE6971918.1 hypothetical protein [Cereibacter sphaeroides]